MLLTFLKLTEESALGLELLKVALLLHVSGFKHENLIAFLNCTHSMSDDDGGPSRHDILKGLLYLLLRVFVKSRSGFVQKQHLWLSNDSSSNGYSLLLPA